MEPERRRIPSWRALGVLALSSATLGAQTVEVPPTTIPWDAAHAEHLWNRAGFGAGSAEIERSLALGLERQVEELLHVDGWIEEPFYARKRADGDLGKYVRSLPEAERERKKDELRAADRAQVDDFLDWWVQRMIASDEPLRERMVLFWHGHFTSSMEAVKSSYEMIQQNQLFRRHALGSFRELLHGVARDPAMLLYLDNDSSKKAHPNENFARELLELYTLGEGHYSEEDVKEVARAFTGWGQRNGRFRFDARQHDRGMKRVLGVEGRLDGGDVIEILLRQEACARHLARALLFYFEAVDPASERLERYAAELRDSGYRIDVFLRHLLLDPEFYASEKRGSRVASPLDFLVGSSRRLGASLEPRLLVTSSTLLGQRLFFPPSVRGWEGGRTWATGSSLLLRGQLAGLLVGRATGRELVDDLRGVGDGPEAMDDESRMGKAEEAARKKIPAELRALSRLDPHPRFNLVQRLSRGGATSDAELARALLEEVLAIPPSEELVRGVEERLGLAREANHLEEASWASRPELAEPLLRAIVEDVLSLPEAQLD